MARSNPTQSSFLGGEWSPVSYGRFDTPEYKTALEVCMNGLPVEEGSWIRRSGTQTLGPTYDRLAAKFIGFQSSAQTYYLLEFTNDALRMWYDVGPVCTADRQVITASSSTSGVISLTTTTSHGWAVGDHIIIYAPTTLLAADLGIIANRHFRIATQDGTTGLTIKDDIGVALPSDISSGGLNGGTAIRIKRFATTITTAMLPNVRVVQAQTQGIILSGIAPQVLTVTTDRTSLLDTEPVLSYAALTFTDGPYLDYQGSPNAAETGTVSGGSVYSGSGVTFTPASTTFVASDVGRLIRLFSQPAAWNSGTTYNYGDTVTYPAGTSQYWTSVDKNNANTNQIPGSASIQTTTIPLQYWAPAPAEGQWAWATITAQASTSCTITYTTPLNSKNGTTVSQWQLGVYFSGQYPTCGILHEGRLWLGGAIPNRFDASVSNGLIAGAVTFSPTDVYGNQNDDNAISGTFNFDDTNAIYWFSPDARGLLIGTSGSEVLLSSSTLDDPMTPMNIRARRESKYRSANVPPVHPEPALVFVQHLQLRVLEYLTASFIGGFSANHINKYAKHLSVGGIKEIAYQEETVPVVWALTNDGLLTGCTYRRVARFSSEPALFNGWHQHLIGDGVTYTVNSMAVVDGIDNTSTKFYLNVLDADGYYWVDLMQPLFEDV